MAGGRARGARQRPHHLLRPQHRHHPHRAARPQIPQRRLRRQRRPVDPVRGDLGLHGQALLVRRPEDRQRSRWCSTICRAIPTTSISPPTAITGWRWSACAAPRSTSPGGCRVSGGGWRSALPVDEWLFPNINTGCVVKFNERGEILESLWDLGGVNHPMITSMREHRGYLYLGGILNNRIGRYQAGPCRSEFRAVRRALGEAVVMAASRHLADRFLGRGEATITVPPVRRPAEAEPAAGSGATVPAHSSAPRISRPTARRSSSPTAPRSCVWRGSAGRAARFDRPIIGALLPPRWRARGGARGRRDHRQR